MCYSTLGILLLASCVLDCTAQAFWYNAPYKGNLERRSQPFYGVKITRPNAWSDQLQREITQALQNLQSGMNNLGTLTFNQKSCTSGNFESRFDKIEDRLSKIEQLISQTNGNMATVVENLLEPGLDRIMEKIAEVDDRLENNSPTTDSTPEISEREFSLKLSATEDRLAEKISQMELKVDKMALMNAHEASSQTEKSKAVLTTVEGVSNRLEDVENSLKKLQLVVENPMANSEAILRDQQRTLGDVKKVLTNTENLVRNIPTRQDDMILHNQTQAVLREAEHALEIRVNLTIGGMMSQVTANEKEIKKGIEALRSDLASKTDCADVNNELHNIINKQAAVVPGVYTNKVEEEFSEFGAMINDQIALAKKTFDGIAKDIMSNHSQALANSENAIIHELHQVMTPINAIQQQFTVTAKTLGELHDQNEARATSTTSALGAIASQLNDSKERERQIDSNLNSLLVRVPAVTQEFDHVKTGLDAVLDNVKASLKEMQNKTIELLNHPLPCSFPDTEFNNTLFEINAY